MATLSKSSQVGDFIFGFDDPQSKLGIDTPTSGNPSTPLKIDVVSLTVDSPSTVMDDNTCLVLGITQDCHLPQLC